MKVEYFVDHVSDGPIFLDIRILAERDILIWVYKFGTHINEQVVLHNVNNVFELLTSLEGDGPHYTLISEDKIINCHQSSILARHRSNLV